MPIYLGMSTIQNLGLQGIQKGLAGIAEKADKISKSFTPESTEEPSAAIVGMKLDEFQVKASAKVVKVGDDLEKTILDILA